MVERRRRSAGGGAETKFFFLKRRNEEAKEAKGVGSLARSRLQLRLKKTKSCRNAREVLAGGREGGGDFYAYKLSLKRAFFRRRLSATLSSVFFKTSASEKPRTGQAQHPKTPPLRSSRSSMTSKGAPRSTLLSFCLSLSLPLFFLVGCLSQKKKNQAPAAESRRR